MFRAMSIKDIFPIDNWNFKSEAVFADLPEDDFNMLMAHKTEQLYKKGEMIFREGMYPAGIFYISSGKAKKYKVDKEGKEQILYVANMGELLGFQPVLSHERHTYSAATLEESRIIFIPKEDFLNAIEHSHVLSKRLLKTLSHEFAVLANSLSMLAQKSVRERLALQLIVLREKYKTNTPPGRPVEINMSRDDLAGIVSTARENVVRLLREFKDAGIISTQGRKIIVNDVNKLIQIAN